jgi:hypothetical protein
VVTGTPTYVGFNIVAGSQRAGRCPDCGAPVVYARGQRDGRTTPYDPPLEPLETFTELGQLVQTIDLTRMHKVSCAKPSTKAKKGVRDAQDQTEAAPGHDPRATHDDDTNEDDEHPRTEWRGARG